MPVGILPFPPMKLQEHCYVIIASFGFEVANTQSRGHLSKHGKKKFKKVWLRKQRLKEEVKMFYVLLIVVAMTQILVVC